MKFETLLNGYAAAHSRFEKARLAQDTESTPLPLFDALNWAVVMDDHIRLHWKPEGRLLGFQWRNHLEPNEQAVVNGIRFVRNRVHHQWADALQLHDGGFQTPIVFPVVFHEWSWTPVENIPPGKDDRGIDEYRSALQGRPVRLSLSALERAYRKMASEHLT